MPEARAKRASKSVVIFGENLWVCDIDFIKTGPRPGLNGALFAELSGAKKREWKTETGAQIPKFTVKDVLLNL